MVKSMQTSIEDIHTQPQRLAIGVIVALLLTRASYGCVVSIHRHNEAKYLKQFSDESVTSN
jgi:hypothetical protein